MMSKESKKSGVKELLLFSGGDKEGISITRFEEEKSMAQMPNNKVLTAKYNWYNALPLNIMN